MRQRLTIGLDFAAPIPLHTDLRSGNFEGYEVDLMQKISKNLNCQLSYKVALWKDILQSLQNEEIDAICSAATITEERKQLFDFSIPYLNFQLCAITHKDTNISTLSSLNGKSIGVRTATEAEKYLRQSVNAPKEIRTADTNDELYDLLKQKTIEAIIDDSPIAGALIKASPLKLAFFLPRSASAYGIMFKKGNDDLKKEVDAVITAFKNQGFLQQLTNKWFAGIEL